MGLELGKTKERKSGRKDGRKKEKETTKHKRNVAKVCILFKIGNNIGPMKVERCGNIRTDINKLSLPNVMVWRKAVLGASDRP